MKRIFLVVAACLAVGAIADEKCGSGNCCEKKLTAEEKFLKEADEMRMAAEGKKLCCKSKPGHAMAKGEKGCCNEHGALAKFKVWAGDKYAYFGCQGSAQAGRAELLAKGVAAGKVQPVSGKVHL